MPAIRSAVSGALIALAVTVGAALGAASVAPGAAHAEIDPKLISIIPFDQLNFEGKPGQAQTAKVFGDPTKPGWYGIVIKWPPHTNSRPHSHPYDRYITVLSGTWWIDSGTKFRPDAMAPMKPGAFVIHHAGEPHYDGAKDEPAMIYIVGMGPATVIPREDK